MDELGTHSYQPFVNILLQNCSSPDPRIDNSLSIKREARAVLAWRSNSGQAEVLSGYQGPQSFDSMANSIITDAGPI